MTLLSIAAYQGYEQTHTAHFLHFQCWLWGKNGRIQWNVFDYGNMNPVSAKSVDTLNWIYVSHVSETLSKKKKSQTLCKKKNVL